MDVFSARGERGFSLIELLIVLAIIGVLAAIAIPSFLGTRDKSRQKSLIASAKNAESEMTSTKWVFIGGEPFLALDPSSNMKCFESMVAQSNCAKMYPDISSVGLYNNTSLDELVDIIVDNYRGKNIVSPYGVSPFLFVNHEGTVGTISISVVGAKYLKVRAYGLDTAIPIYNTVL